MVAPESPKEWYYAGKKIKESPEIIAYYEEGLKKRPKFHQWAWLGIGNGRRMALWSKQSFTEDDLKEYKESSGNGAISAYEKALAINPKFSIPWVNIGCVREDLGDKDGAIAAFQKAIELEPTYSYAWICLSQYYFILGRWEKGIETLGNGLKVCLGDPEFWDFFLGCLRHSKDQKEARFILEFTKGLEISVEWLKQAENVYENWVDAQKKGTQEVQQYEQVLPKRPVKRPKRGRRPAKRMQRIPGAPKEWEQWYPLANDPDLQAAGIEIGARAVFQAGSPPQLRIMFRAGGKEASAECVHAAIYQEHLESLSAEGELIRSSEEYSLNLAPEEHFFALNSYVAGIAEVGLGAMFVIAREAGNLPVGLNNLMQNQIFEALFTVACDAAIIFQSRIIDPIMYEIEEDFPCPRLLDKMQNALIWDPERPYDPEEEFIKIPPKLLDRFARTEDIQIRIGVAHHEDTLGETLDHLAKDADVEVRLQVAQNPNSPQEALARLAMDEDSAVFTAVARNPNAAPETLAFLARDQFEIMRADVANNPNASSTTLECLATDVADSVRAGVAANGNTPLGVLTNLIMDPAIQVRRALSKNRKTSPELLGRLALEEDENVRAGVAGNENAPTEILARLAEDISQLVRLNVSVNRNTPKENLLRLARDRSVQSGVATNENTPQEILTQLGKEEDILIRQGLARNKQTSPEILVQFATDNDYVVRHYVARNENTPVDTLVYLADDEEKGVRYEVFANKHTPPEIRDRLIKSDPDFQHELEIEKRNYSKKYFD